MTKVQKVNFQSIEDFLAFIPPHERRIVNHLRAIIKDCLIDGNEKLAYNVPHFYAHSRVCFIWPSSVQWGNVKRDGVSLGFCNGHLMCDEMNYLERGTRKQVYAKTFMSVDEIDEDIVRMFVFEALRVDQELMDKKRRKSKYS